MKTGSIARARSSFLVRLLLIPVLLAAATAHAAEGPAAGYRYIAFSRPNVVRIVGVVRSICHREIRLGLCSEM